MLLHVIAGVIIELQDSIKCNIDIKRNTSLKVTCAIPGQKGTRDKIKTLN